MDLLKEGTLLVEVLISAGGLVCLAVCPNDRPRATHVARVIHSFGAGFQESSCQYWHAEKLPRRMRRPIGGLDPQPSRLQRRA